SSSIRTRSRSNASFNAATTTPARRVSRPRAAVSGTAGYDGSSVARTLPPMRTSPLTVSITRIQSAKPLTSAYGEPDFEASPTEERIADCRLWMPLMIRKGSPRVGNLGEDGVDVRTDETWKVVGGTVQGEDLSESWTGNREVPAVAGLRPEQ